MAGLWGEAAPGAKPSPRSADMLVMNERREQRIEANQSVRITILGEPEAQLPALIKNVSVRGVGLELRCRIAAGAAVKIELKDAMLLGEVIFCREDAESYYAGVELEHALFGLTELQLALDGFPDSLSGPEQAHAVVERRYQN
jgi:hypothetical protein